jgi:hypothetical protein
MNNFVPCIFFSLLPSLGRDVQWSIAFASALSLHFLFDIHPPGVFLAGLCSVNFFLIYTTYRF